MTPDQATKLAELLLAGRTRREAGAELGIGIRTVSAWKKSMLVQSEMERLSKRTSEVRAVDVLLELLGSQDERVRLEAAKLVLGSLKIQRAPEEPLPPTEPPTAPDGYVFLPVRDPFGDGA